MLKNFYFKRLILAVLILSQLPGCAYRDINDTIKRVDDNNQSASDYLHKINNTRISQDSTFTINKGTWVDTKPVDIPASEITPVALTCNITFAPKVPITLFDFVRKITSDCNVPVRLSPDAIAAFSGGDSGNESNSARLGQTGNTSAGTIPAPPSIGGTAIPASVTLPAVPGGANASASTSVVGSGGTQGIQSGARVFTVTYQGALKGLLDRVLGMLSLSWSYTPEKGIVISYTTTETFTIAALPSVTATSTVVKSASSASTGQLSGSGSNSGGNGDSGTNTLQSQSLSSDLIKDITTNLQSMLTPGVGRMAMSPSTGSVTITDTQQVLDRVRVFLRAENAKITQQILFNVKVLKLTLSDSNNLDLSANIVAKALSGKMGFSLKNDFVDTTANLTTGQVTILDPKSSMSGTSALINALSTQGKVSVVTSPSVTTLNLQPAPVQVARQTSYIAQRTVTSTANVGTQSSITPGTVTVGFNMSLLPYILPDTRDIIVQYNINLSSLIQIRQSGDTNNRVEMPEVDSRVFSQRVKLLSGQTLILSGFEQVADNGTKSGVGDASWWGFGGSRSSSSTKDILVVIITPYIL